MEVLLSFAGFCVLLSFVFWVVENHKAARTLTRLKPKLDDLEKQQEEHAQKIEADRRTFAQEVDAATRAHAQKVDAATRAHVEKVRADEQAQAQRVEADRQALERLVAEKSTGMPWLAQSYADYLHLQDLKKAEYLERKSHPAPTAAQQVREIATDRKVAEQAWRLLKYQMEYYENLFPFLVDFKEEELDTLFQQNQTELLPEDVEAEEQDPVRHWLTQREYQSLPPRSRNQLALDRYWTRKKSRWELGRDYERFVGYRYEADRCQVHYQGIIEGYSDLGRDLIVIHQEGNVEIVQCKYWSKDKVIHEKHIFQLYGTLIAYKIDHPSTNVSATFVTSTVLSDRARQFAKALDIRCVENHPLDKYPCIKCNVSTRNSERIYHLPFDQQYDKTLIEHLKFERYAWTVDEAEGLGFRRAFKWHGDKLT